MRLYSPHRRPAALAVLLLSCLSAFCASVKIGNSGQDLYAKEGDEGSKVATLPSGTVLEKIGEGTGGWIKVKAPTVDCWIFGDTVSGETVTSSRGRVRTAPNPTAREIAILPRGAKIEPRGKQGDWIKIAPPQSVAFWVKPDSVKETKDSPTRAPVAQPVAPVEIPKPTPPPPEPPKVEPPKPTPPQPEPPKPVAIPQPEPLAVEPPKPVAPVVPEPLKPVAPVIPEPPKTVPQYADQAEIHPKWEPPKEPPMKPAEPPVVVSAPVEVVKTPPTATKPVPKPAPVVTPDPPKPTPVATAPKPVAPPVRHDPPPVVAPAPASGPTISWNTSPSRTISAPRAVNPQPSHSPTWTPARQPAPQTDVTSGWESAPAAAPAVASSTAAPVRSTGAGKTSLPCREFSSEWEDPTPGTLLSRKVPSNKHLRSTPPTGISPERLRRDVFQGEMGHATGVLVHGGSGFRMRPSEYELRTIHADGSSELVAYVYGSDAQLRPYIEKTVRVDGTCWWLGGASAALLVPTAPIQTAN